MTEAEAESHFRKHPAGQKQYSKPIGPESQPKKTFTEKAKETFGKVKTWAENHPVNNPVNKKEPLETREPGTRRQPTRIDRYDSRGKKVESIYYSEPKEHKPRKQSRSSHPLGEFGSMGFGPLLPSSRGDIFTSGLGGLDPMHHTKPAPRRKPKRKSQPKPFDYLDYMGRSPFH